MGDEVTCPVCGRGLSVKGHLKPGLSYDCVKLGYERSQAALAAARRECEESRKALRLAAKYLRDGAPVRTALEWIEDALAAPAAGDSK